MLLQSSLQNKMAEFFSCGSFDVLVVSSGIASTWELKEQMGKCILLCREEWIPGQEVWET